MYRGFKGKFRDFHGLLRGCACSGVSRGNSGFGFKGELRGNTMELKGFSGIIEGLGTHT